MISVILCAGGLGKRFGSALPKQFLPLGDHGTIVHASYELLCSLSEVTEVIVVCSDQYRPHFSHPKTKFAEPGKRRQDSVYNGARIAASDYLCIHDGARPFVTKNLALAVLKAGMEMGAAAPALPVTSTIKMAGPQNFVQRTLDRDGLYEIQTPQVVRKDLFIEGFLKAQDKGLTITDDVGFIELIGHPVKLIEGSPRNIKITTPFDLSLAKALLEELSPP